MSEELIPRAQVGELDPPRDPAQLHRNTMLAVSVGICAWMVRMDPLIGGGFVVFWGGYTWVLRRRVRARTAWWRTYAELNGRLGATDDGEAWRLVRELEASPGDWVARGAIAAVRGYLEATGGDLDAACDSLANAVRWLEPRRRAVPKIYAWATYHAAIAHLGLGRLGVADVYLGLVRRGQAAGTLTELDLLRAFAHGLPDELGNDEELAEHVAVARAGDRPLVLALVAWAHHELGEADRATPLVEEARARIGDGAPRFAALYPRVWAWLSSYQP